MSTAQNNNNINAEISAFLSPDQRLTFGTADAAGKPSVLFNVVTSKLFLLFLAGAALCAFAAFVFYEFHPFGWYPGGWRLRIDPSTVTCDPRTSACTVEHVMTCPSGNCTSAAPTLIGSVRIPCPRKLAEASCTPGTWVPGPTPDANCINPNTREPLSCTGSDTMRGSNPSGNGIYDKIQWTCSTKMCLEPPPPPNTMPPQTAVPCSTTSCDNYQMQWLRCINGSTLQTERNCYQSPDPTQPANCLLGSTCIGLPPTVRSCNQCYTLGPWSSECMIGCADGDQVCMDSIAVGSTANLPPETTRMKRLLRRSVTCTTASSITGPDGDCDVSLRPSATLQTTACQNQNIVQFYSLKAMGYFSIPRSSLFSSIGGKPVAYTRNIGEALTFYIWAMNIPQNNNQSQTQTNKFFWLQDRETGLFLGVGASGLVVLAEKNTKRQAWMVDPGQTELMTESGQLLLWNGTNWYASAAGAVTTDPSDRWLVSPSITFPLPISPS